MWGEPPALARSRLEAGPGNPSKLSADGQELVGPVVAQLLRAHVAEILEGSLDGVTRGFDGGLGLPVRATRRLRDDPVDDAEPEEILGGDLHVGRGILGAGR